MQLVGGSGGVADCDGEPASGPPVAEVVVGAGPGLEVVRYAVAAAGGSAEVVKVAGDLTG